MVKVADFKIRKIEIILLLFTPSGNNQKMHNTISFLCLLHANRKPNECKEAVYQQHLIMLLKIQVDAGLTIYHTRNLFPSKSSQQCTR